MPKLIVETESSEVVVKSSPLKLPIILSGIFLEGAKRNNNGRLYQMDDLITATNEFQPIIKAGRALAELEHPEATVINPDRACARITSLVQKNNQFLGEAVVLAADPNRGILGTPCGTLLGSLLQYGTKVGWSSRGLGDQADDDTVSNFHLVTIDCVLNPSIGYMADSNATRFVDGILESTNTVVNNHNRTQLVYEAFVRNISNLSIDKTTKRAKLNSAINTFLSSIKGV